MERLKTIGSKPQGLFLQSRELRNLVKSINKARSKAEEDQIVLNEIETLKRLISEPDIPQRKMKEFIIRLVYLKILGHDVSFGYIHAVKITKDNNLSVKLTGYLAVRLILFENPGLTILTVDCLKEDLKSENDLVVCAALDAVCSLSDDETIEAVLASVENLLTHPEEVVKKKAVTALHCFHKESPASLASEALYKFGKEFFAKIEKSLSQKDLGVLGATLCAFFDLITKNAKSYKGWVTIFVNILEQVVEHRLPKNEYYHHMPAPFIQVELLKILALLYSDDEQEIIQMNNVLREIFLTSCTSSGIGNAVLYECVCCVSCTNPNQELIQQATDVMSRFLESDSRNLNYMGINALARLIKITPEIAQTHQPVLINYLKDRDDSLKMKAFKFLYNMKKSSNVEVADVDLLIRCMKSSTVDDYKTRMAVRCVKLSERIAPNYQWFIEKMNEEVFEHAGNLVYIELAHTLMRLIALERDSVVESYLQFLSEPAELKSTFLLVICWFLGEYGPADGKFSASYITGKLCDVAEAYSNDETGYVAMALMKIFLFEIAAGQEVDILPKCQSLMKDLLGSHSTDAHAGESSDASGKDLQIDKSLSFLDGYVQKMTVAIVGLQSMGAGLFNLGDKCYINVILQALTHTVPLIQSLCSSYHICISSECPCLLCALHKHVRLV